MPLVLSCDAKIEEVITRTLESKPDNATHGSTRNMVQRVGLSQSAIVRIWHAFGLQPHKSETFKLSSDPFFVEKVRALAASLVLVLIAGCGSGGKKDLKAVSGTVKYRGAPLANGSIQFAPAANSKATTQQASDVRDGKYEIAVSRGLEPGKYQVRIYSSASEDDLRAGRLPGGNAAQQQLPEQYNIKTNLEREVKADSPTTIDFDLK